MMAKVDIKQAYRNIPLHPDERGLMGMSWDGGLFIDTALPFGLWSAPKIFNAVADAVEWILRHQGIGCVIHYLDDFLLVGRPASEECAEALSTLLRVFSCLGLPVAIEKLEGPTSCLVSYPDRLKIREKRSGRWSGVRADLRMECRRSQFTIVVEQ